MQVVRGVKFIIISSLATVTLTTLSAATSETPKFLVECHAFVAAKGDIPKDYAYHLNAVGFPKEVTNGIDVNLDEKNIFLAVGSRQPKTEAYSALYTNLPLVMSSRQPCADGKCKQVEYEPKTFKGKLIVTYDKDNGVMFIKHVLTAATTVQARGGCLFVPLQLNKSLV